MKILLSLAASALLLAGCAVSPEQRAKSAPGAVQVAPDQGLVALKITTNRPMVSTFFNRWNTLRVRNTSSKETFTLVDRSDSSASHSLFVQALPAGDYEIDAVGNMASGAVTITSNADASGAFPTFRVGDGQMTDLGTLAYIRAHHPLNSGRYQWGQVESPFDRQAVMRQLDPALAARLGARPVLGWNPGDQLRGRRETFADLRRMTMRALAPTPLTDGSMLFGESFGQIAIRGRTGDWRWLQTPTALPIRALHAAQDGTVFAGSDDGILLSGRIDGASWQPIALPVSDASVIYVGAGAGGAELIVVLQTRDKFIALSGSRAAPGQWTEQFSKPRGLFTNPQMDERGVALETGAKLLLVTGGTESDAKVVAYSRGEKTWKPVEGPSFRGGLLNWASMRDGSVGRFAGIPLTGMYFTASSDSGASWEKRGELNWTSGPLLFVSDTTGFVVRSEGMPTADAQVALWRTDDGGRSWTKGGSLPALLGTLVALGGTEQIGYASANGKFLVSGDGGKTWRLEREVP